MVSKITFLSRKQHMKGRSIEHHVNERREGKRTVARTLIIANNLEKENLEKTKSRKEKSRKNKISKRNI
jgi:hypothetical protein